ncbi:MAG: transposase [Gammaproteobacteria bacterium]|nr:transposase [Gammaproteobacteria bacterium]
MESIVESVLLSMSSVKKPQRLFLSALFSALMVFQGKATFRNLSRYSSLHEKRLSRWFRRSFDFAQFNRRLLQKELPQKHDQIAAIDASFMKKSGQKTAGLGWFYNGALGQAMVGLELSLVCRIDLQSRTAYALEARQTLDSEQKEGESRVDCYAKQVCDLAGDLQAQGIRYLTADAYYSKVKFVDAVCSDDLHLIGKLRSDANLSWYFEGEYGGKGRPKTYDGKVNFQTELSRFDACGVMDKGVSIYSAVVHSCCFKRKIRVVLLRWEQKTKVRSALLFSTDSELAPEKIVEYYTARFQIEFLFREAKQHTGLMDCQARCPEAIQTHINASFTALNLLKLEDRKDKNNPEPSVISIASWRRKKFNQYLMKILFDKLGLERSCQKVEAVYHELSEYGAIQV